MTEVCGARVNVSANEVTGTVGLLMANVAKLAQYYVVVTLTLEESGWHIEVAARPRAFCWGDSDRQARNYVDSVTSILMLRLGNEPILDDGTTH